VTGSTDSGVADTVSVSDATSATDATSVTDSGATDTSTGGGSDSSSGTITGGPCQSGAVGQTAWRFSFRGPGTSASWDVYGLPDKSSYSASAVYSTSYGDSSHGGGIEIGSGNWILILYSVTGLHTIRSASVSVYGRSYDTTTSGSFEAWTPTYGSAATPTDSMSNAWPYAWTTVDFTGYVNPGDPPASTGIRLYSGPSSSTIVVHTVELCIDGD
jgi:hypothetical protein